jgi:hypothetical protein
MIPTEAQIDTVCRETGMERMQAMNHLRGREILRLRLSSPKRSMTSQSDAGHLPLFVAGNEPNLF